MAKEPQDGVSPFQAGHADLENSLKHDHLEALTAAELDEEIALLQGSEARSKTGDVDRDGDATYQHETWGFIGKSQTHRSVRLAYASHSRIAEVANFHCASYRLHAAYLR